MTPPSPQSLCVPDTADLRSAMLAIQQAGVGVVLVIDAAERVVGLLTDGDIRRAMLKREDLSLGVSLVMNRDFAHVRVGTPKEHVLKLLDNRIHVVPILDDRGRLVELVRAGYLEPKSESYARARAPVRLSLAGGGTDFTQHFMRHGGVSLCTTINKHAHAILRRRDDGRVRIYSHDLRQTVEYADVSELAYDGRLDLIKAGIRLMRPHFGFELSVSCDFGAGTGLGGSASLLAAVIGCFNEYREDRLNSYSVAEMAFEAERVQLNVAGGWQDQYATVFGGFNFIEFDKDQNTVVPLRICAHTLLELEERFLICYSGRNHLGEAIQRQNQARDADDPAVLSFAGEIKSVAFEMRANLLRGNLADFGRMLDTTWKLKRSFDARVSDDHLDAIYERALAAGAEGGRLLGTGGGGYFLFFVKPFQRYSVMCAMEELGLSTECVTFDVGGLTSWMSRL